MNTYNISHQGIVIFRRIPEKDVESHRAAIKNFIWMGSSGVEMDKIEEDIEVTLNT